MSARAYMAADGGESGRRKARQVRVAQLTVSPIHDAGRLHSHRWLCLLYAATGKPRPAPSAFSTRLETNAASSSSSSAHSTCDTATKFTAALRPVFFTAAVLSPSDLTLFKLRNAGINGIVIAERRL